MTEFSDWVGARLTEQEGQDVNARQIETGQRLLAALEIWDKELSVYTSHVDREQVLYEREWALAHVIMVLSGLFLIGIIVGAMGITSDIPKPEAMLGLALILLVAVGSRWDHKRRLRDASERDELLDQRIARVQIGMGRPRH